MGNLNRIMLLCIVPASILKGTAAALVTVPRDKMVLLNAATELQCSTNSVENITWSFTPADGHIVTDWLFIHGNFTAYGVGKYNINRSIRGQYNLVIKSVNFSYAGRYRCIEGSFGTESEAELVVIDPQPLCQTNASTTLAENRCLWMQCILSYSGKANLSMTWIRKSSESVIQSMSNLRNQFMFVIRFNSSDNVETLTLKATFTKENNSCQQVITSLTIKATFTQENNSCQQVITLNVLHTMNSLTPPDSYAVISRPTLAVTMMLWMAVLIGVSVYFRANVKAWAIQHCALITHREPDFVRMGQENRYYASITHQGSNRSDLLLSTLTANQTNVVGAEGTEYVQLSGAKPPDRNGEEHTPRTSAFNKVEIYASIDHSGTVPAPPLPPKSSSVY